MTTIGQAVGNTAVYAAKQVVKNQDSIKNVIQKVDDAVNKPARDFFSSPAGKEAIRNSIPLSKALY